MPQPGQGPVFVAAGLILIYEFRGVYPYLPMATNAPWSFLGGNEKSILGGNEKVLLKV